MAFAASDGKQFTNRPPMMAHERSMKRMGGIADHTDPLKQPTDGMDDDADDGAAVAEEHGPAHEVHVMHNHEEGSHHVHSVHPDGHEHHSEHASVEEAHDHAKQLAGSESSEEPDADDEEEPEYD